MQQAGLTHPEGGHHRDDLGRTESNGAVQGRVQGLELAMPTDKPRQTKATWRAREAR